MRTTDRPKTRRHEADGAPAPGWWSAVDRRMVGFALAFTMLAVPVLVLDNLPHGGTAPAEAVEAAAPTTTSAAAPTTTATTAAAVTTTTTTAAPTPTTAAPTTTTAAPTTTTTLAVRRASTTTTTSPPTTEPPPTTEAPPVTEAPVAPADPGTGTGGSQSGQASWYHWRAGECAHRTLPIGTVVTVTNVGTGASTTCTVTDRGPYGSGRIIDLDESVFAQIASTSAGVITVTITW